jgi:hypothetical protein
MQPVAKRRFSMNPMVSTILNWEKELEIKSQARKNAGLDQDMFQPVPLLPRPAGRMSILDRISRALSTSPRPSSECP